MRIIVAGVEHTWREQVRAQLEERGLASVCLSSLTREEMEKCDSRFLASADVAVVLVDRDDPLPDVARLWGDRPTLPVLLFGTSISPALRTAALEAGVFHVGPPVETAEELSTLIAVACDGERMGSPELVRAMCRAMCTLSSAATKDDPQFLAIAVREVAALFGATVVSALVRDGDSLRVVASTDATRRGAVVPPESVAWRVIRSRAPRILLRGTDTDPELRDVTAQSGVSASMLVPFPGRNGDAPRGMLAIARTARHAVFVPRDLDVCASIAALIAESLAAMEARAVSRDLRERMAAVERLTTVGEIAAGIAHEVANPISAVRTNVAELIATMRTLAPVLAAIDGDKDIAESLEDLPALLSETWEAVDRATTIIKQMKAFVQLNTDPLAREEKVELGAIVNDTVRLMRRRLTADVRVESQEPVVVSGSSVELAQVLVNLAVNASDACDERKNARTSDVGYRPQIVVRTTAELDYGVLEVQDNGTGMTPEMMQRIFAPLFTTKTPERGTGLGLAIVRRVVDSHHGSVSVSSVVGEGTTFRIRVPRDHASPPG